MTKIQQEFEVWAIKHHFSTTKKPDGKSYAHDSTVCAFEGWKASRAALCVELPSRRCSSDSDYYACGFDNALYAVEIKMEMAGVSYK